MVAASNNLTFRSAGCVLIALILGACTGEESSYYPLEAGSWWYFRTETTILDEKHEQRLSISNLGRGDLDGQTVSIQRQSSGREVYFRPTSRGIERVGVRVPVNARSEPTAAIVVIPSSLETGVAWQTPSRLRLIESRTFARQDKLHHRVLPIELAMSIVAIDDTVTVPAGTFERCIRLEGVATRTVRTDRGNAVAEVHVSHQEWYAPKVGLVKVIRSETSDSPFLKAGYYVQELLRFEP